MSIGEPTTDTCVWSLKRLGFEVVLIADERTSLWDKLKLMFDEVGYEDFLRVDADVICNRNVLKLVEWQSQAWYIQSLCWDWLKQDLGYNTPSFIRREALSAIRTHLNEAQYEERPETYLTRLPEFYQPRRAETANLICGLHGYAQADYERVKQQKQRRGQDYDWELFEKVNAL